MSSDKTKSTPEEIPEAYEPPAVDDLDTSRGPAETPTAVMNSGGGGTKAAPRELG